MSLNFSLLHNIIWNVSVKNIVMLKNVKRKVIQKMTLFCICCEFLKWQQTVLLCEEKDKIFNENHFDFWFGQFYLVNILTILPG